MHPFIDLLRVGGRSNSLGRSGEVLDAVLADRDRLGELYACVLLDESADDAWVRMRAIDAMEKLARSRPEWVRALLPDMLERLTLSEQPSIQWHLAQILAEVPLTAAQERVAVAWLRARVESTDVDWIVSVAAMTTLVGLARAGRVEAVVVAAHLQTQAGHRSTSVRRKAERLLARLADPPSG